MPDARCICVASARRTSAATASVEALAPTDLDVDAGEFVCLLGASGCGKSTLLQLIAGLESASSGTIAVDDTPVTGPGSDRVLLFQDAALFPWLTVEDNVEFGLRQLDAPAPTSSSGSPTTGSTASTCAGSRRPRSTSCRAACGSARRWPARWRPTRRCC